MDFHARIAGLAPSEQARKDIVRVTEIWRECRHELRGKRPFLFGAFTIADAMYAPVVTRFGRYGIDLARFRDDRIAAGYAEMLLAMPRDAGIGRRRWPWLTSETIAPVYPWK